MKHRGVICEDCDTECRIGVAKECWNPALPRTLDREMAKFWIDPILEMISAIKRDIVAAVKSAFAGCIMNPGKKD